ncbi:unnamed protein product [Ceratitis capitata]|uniref:(Mediterranean fruit fly) hypothetical protein n=1 Tax=Ceratitis capitata TaxID=7213 RepID=A0A811VHE1_CERCA|nr:unnamed protein product [Ceratitis capitata]
MFRVELKVPADDDDDDDVDGEDDKEGEFNKKQANKRGSLLCGNIGNLRLWLVKERYSVVQKWECGHNLLTWTIALFSLCSRIATLLCACNYTPRVLVRNTCMNIYVCMYKCPNIPKLKL